MNCISLESRLYICEAKGYHQKSVVALMSSKSGCMDITVHESNLMVAHLKV